jgi:hypothetical protein
MQQSNDDGCESHQALGCDMGTRLGCIQQNRANRPHAVVLCSNLIRARPSYGYTKSRRAPSYTGPEGEIAASLNAPAFPALCYKPRCCISVVRPMVRSRCSLRWRCGGIWQRTR